MLRQLSVAFQNLDELEQSLQNLSREDCVKFLKESLISCQEWERVVDSSVDGIFLADSSGRALYANTAYERLSGLRRSEIEGAQLQDFLGRNYVDKVGSLIALESKRPTTIESVFPRTGKHTLVTCNPIFDENGEISIVVSNVRDLTQINQLRDVVSQTQRMVTRYRSELEALRERLQARPSVIAQDPISLELLLTAEQIAQVDSTVLITGETGVGKEEIAKYVHGHSRRKNGHFVKMNCSAIAESLFESELFGYEKGAFTGAKSEGKAGLFEAANNGTIFLDEVGEIPLHLQAKLLRVIQEKELTRVGGITPIPIDVRILAATNRDLQKMVADKQFRSDLYYRLNVVPLHIPPLRERKKDILPLAESFLQKLNRKYDYHRFFSDTALMQLEQYSWPGNVRELRNVVERAVILSATDEVGFHSLLPEAGAETGAIPEGDFDLEEYLQKIEFNYMKAAYEKYGNFREAAEAVHMKRSTFAGKFLAYRQRYEEGA